MSGGSLDYAYRHLEALAKEIAGKLENKEVDSRFGNDLAKTEQKIILAEINKLITDLNAVAKRSKNLEWWLSGDYGKEDYIDAITKKTA